MTDSTESLLRDRFRRLEHDEDTSDWLDVLRRARPRSSSRRPLILALATVVALATGAALASERGILDFLVAEKAPRSVQVQFETLNALASPELSPRANAAEARRIIHGQLGGRRHPLSIAPTPDGGFCFVWTDWAAGCARTGQRSSAEEPAIALAYPVEPGEAPRGVSGHVLDPTVATIELRYTDGARSSTPAIWISPPIDAGFFFFSVAPARREIATAPVEVVARDGNGAPVARRSIPRAPAMREVRSLPDGRTAVVPADADVARARQVRAFRASDGTRMYLWVMPSREGGRCYIHNYGSGCSAPQTPRPMLASIDYSSGIDVFFAEVSADVAAVEMRFADRRVERLLPREGFVLEEIRSTQRERSVVVEAVATSSEGDVLDRQSFSK